MKIDRARTLLARTILTNSLIWVSAFSLSLPSALAISEDSDSDEIVAVHGTKKPKPERKKNPSRAVQEQAAQASTTDLEKANILSEKELKAQAKLRAQAQKEAEKQQASQEKERKKQLAKAEKEKQKAQAKQKRQEFWEGVKDSFRDDFTSHGPYGGGGFSSQTYQQPSRSQAVHVAPPPKPKVQIQKRNLPPKEIYQEALKSPQGGMDPHELDARIAQTMPLELKHKMGLQQELGSLEARTAKAREVLKACEGAECNKRAEIQAVDGKIQKEKIKISLLESRGDQAVAFQDKLVHSALSKWVKTGKWVTLALGNPQVEPNKKAETEIKHLVEGLIAEGYNVLYDADSSEAQTIERATKEYPVVGLSGNPALRTNRKTQTFVVENPFLRMQLFLAASHVIITPDSIVGQGLLIQEFNRNKVRVYELNNTWTPGLAEWSDSLSKKKKKNEWEDSTRRAFLERYGSADQKNQLRQDDSEDDAETPSLGIRYSRSDEPDTFQTAKQLVGSIIRKTFNFRRGVPELDLRAQLPTSLYDLLDHEENVGQILHFSESYANKAKQLRAHAISEEFSNSGAAFFGSSSAPSSLVPMVRSIVQAALDHGFSIHTGGAGGMMEVANSVAAHYEGHSIGIGGGMVAGEHLADKLHDLSIASSGYEERIPMLLQDKKLVLIAPGGGGTMQEVATAFVKIGAGNITEQPFVYFIGDRYYSVLGNFLSKNLSPEYVDRMALVQTVEEFDAMYGFHFLGRPLKN